jgi:hypothetical protein
VKKTTAMYVNCNDKLRIGPKFVETVKDFKYLGLVLSNKCKHPEILLKARINKAKSVFYAVKSNCKLLGISNVRVKL